ncbi:ATP-binding protein [Mesorhizobium sp. M0621]|uniref:AAA family ATPase n=1 Tax=Mesorhizobium sp. M0621 TaxID=2956974 RepID=UPI00333C29E7
MAHTLSFKRSHASINSFPPTTLPDFTLITGPNGSGKTHLLQALNLGFVRTDAAPEQSQSNQSMIKLFDWSNMVPQDSGFFTSESIRNERQSLFTNFTNLKQQQAWLEPARTVARKWGLAAEYVSEPSIILLLSDVRLVNLAGDVEKSATLTNELKSALNSFETNVLNSLDPASQSQLRAVSNYLRKPISALSEKDILSPAIPTWGQSDIFQQSFARLFVAYRDLRLANTLAQFRASKGHDANFLTDDEFIQRHGAPPWDFVNDSLLKANLDFYINDPSPDDYTPFQPTLTKRSSGVSIPFSSLSSGEKILMSFAFCVYYSSDTRQISVRPKVLLLDEIDAPLHPSMSKNIIDTIVEILVGSFGIKIIATTHSPSTIALAPEDSIFTMRSGEPGLHKSSKAAALNILTVGVPTIAISHDGRRQVFVESPADAKIYDSLYKLLKPKLSSDRSLEFVATGTRSAGSSDRNTGCDVVKRLVSELSAAGNISVFGLLDWDGKNNPSNRVSVLAHGSRNGLENVVLDPLLLGIAICRAFSSTREEIGIPASMSYLQLIAGGRELFQKMVTAVTTTVFKSSPTSTSTAIYTDGLNLQIDSRYFTIDDHALEALILTAFPFLNSISRNHPGKLVENVIQNVLGDNPGLMPIEVMTTIEHLLNQPAHI